MMTMKMIQINILSISNIFLLTFCLTLREGLCYNYNVLIDGPNTILLGSSATFNARLKTKPDGGTYKYHWSDNSQFSHSAEIVTTDANCTWTVSYPLNSTKVGDYAITLRVFRDSVLFPYLYAQNKVELTVTDTLNGHLELQQNGSIINGPFVSNSVLINHTIEMAPAISQYLFTNATYVRTYWYRNCSYLGVTEGVSYATQYNSSDKYLLEVFVVASFEKKPDKTTTSTSTSTSTTTSTTAKPIPSTTLKAVSSTVAAVAVTDSVSNISPADNTQNNTKIDVHRSKRSSDSENTTMAVPTTVSTSISVASSKLPSSSTINADVAQLLMTTTTMAPTMTNSTGSNKPIFECPSQMKHLPAAIVNDSDATFYGHFKREIITRDAIGNFTANGQSWLQHGVIVNIEIKCKGSPPLQYCSRVFKAPYNVTGDEDCMFYTNLSECRFMYTRYFNESKTVLFFLRNAVSNTVNKVTINIYEAKKQSQLSVVVVPVTFTLVAIILVVFAVSYYIQSRNRFHVEVADFNFGETQSVDMEYKTFTERLYESLSKVWQTVRIQRWRWPWAFCDGDAEDLDGIVDTENGGTMTGSRFVDTNTPYQSMN